jgi:ectoine hydroxylase-related dioxygenase (phytanoyl-CoA dioxygenase family)
VLRKGDTLIFTASTKHAATPNPTGVARGLLFSLYAVDGREELPTRKHRPQT